jgi:hypothetical protein
MLGSSSVDGTVSEEGSVELVGVTEDSVGLEMVEGVGGKGGSCSGEPGGDGAGIEMLEIPSLLGSSMVDGDETLGSLAGGVNSMSDSKLDVGRDRDGVAGSSGISWGWMST